MAIAWLVGQSTRSFRFSKNFVVHNVLTACNAFALMENVHPEYDSVHKGGSLMKRAVLAALVSALLAFGIGLPVWAHHSFAAAFDMNAPVTVQGTIVQVRLENPHSWFFLDVKNESGKVVRWAFEAGTPSGMVRNGFKPGIIKKGVEVTIKGFHAKDPAQNMGMLRELILADGTVYGMFGSQQGPGAK